MQLHTNPVMRTMFGWGCALLSAVSLAQSAAGDTFHAGEQVLIFQSLPEAKGAAGGPADNDDPPVEEHAEQLPLPNPIGPYPPISDSESFNQAAKALFPLSPDEIGKTLQRARDSQQAQSVWRHTELSGRTIPVTLSGGGRASTIVMAPGYATVLTLIDATGAPWPLIRAVVGDETAVTMTNPGGEYSNMLTVTPRMATAQSNLVMVLEGADAPLIVNLKTSARVANDNMMLQVDRHGPNAKKALVVKAPPGPGDDVMRSLIDGVKPDGVELVMTDGADATAYRYGTRLFLRTQLNLRWPAHMNVAYGVDNMRVYEIPPQALIVLNDDNGITRRLRIDDTGLLLDRVLQARMPEKADGSILEPIHPSRGAYARGNSDAVMGPKLNLIDSGGRR